MAGGLVGPGREIRVEDGQETWPWPTYLRPSSTRSGPVCAAVHVCGLDMLCNCASVCGVQGWVWMAGGWGYGSLAGYDYQCTRVCVCSGVGLPDHMLVCLAMAWPSLRSCGSDCGGVSWAMFVSPELCAFSGACAPGCQLLPYCVYPLICVLGAV